MILKQKGSRNFTQSVAEQKNYFKDNSISTKHVECSFVESTDTN